MKKKETKWLLILSAQRRGRTSPSSQPRNCYVNLSRGLAMPRYRISLSQQVERDISALYLEDTAVHWYSTPEFSALVAKMEGTLEDRETVEEIFVLHT
jgi:hypothetical protein